MNRNLILFVLILLISYVGKMVISSSMKIFSHDILDGTTEQILIRRLLQHYEPSVRPVLQAQAVVTVSFRMEITQLFELVRRIEREREKRKPFR